MINTLMNASDSRALISPPSLIAALRGGFDAISNHIALVLFPITLDLFLWLGPRLRLTQLIKAFVSQMGTLYGLQEPGATELLQVGQEIWMLVAERLNLWTALRSYPVGIPSLMASLMPAEAPGGLPGGWEIPSLGGAFFAWLLISALGLAAGALYYTLVAQAAISGQVSWHQALAWWPRASLQVFFLALFLVVLLIGVSIPGSLIVSIVALGGLTLAQCAILLYGGILLWLIFPLLFSAHGIFVSHQHMMASLKTSLQITRFTILNTTLFFLAVLVLSKGLDILWLTPPETSWLLIIGLVGHAFVTTSLLASSFVYYRDAVRWTQALLRQFKVASQREVV